MLAEKQDGSNEWTPTGGLVSQIPTFETFMVQKLQEYQQMLELLPAPDAAQRMQRALSHVSTIHIGAHAFDATKHLFDTRSTLSQVMLVPAEDNEAVIKILAKGRTAKPRHVARTHRVNLDLLYDIFRFPEVLARYVKQIFRLLTSAPKQ